MNYTFIFVLLLHSIAYVETKLLYCIMQSESEGFMPSKGFSFSSVAF